MVSKHVLLCVRSVEFDRHGEIFGLVETNSDKHLSLLHLGKVKQLPGLFDIALK